MNLSPVYLGGSRNLTNSHPTREAISLLARKLSYNPVPVHVGCQTGADQAVIESFSVWCPSSLFVFAIEQNARSSRLQYLHNPVTVCIRPGLPMKAQLLNRSITAFTGCQAAVFFQPGLGSLAVAREFIKRTYNPVFVLATEEPQPIPGTAGKWQYLHNSWYQQFTSEVVFGWVWSTAQVELF